MKTQNYRMTTTKARCRCMSDHDVMAISFEDAKEFYWSIGIPAEAQLISVRPVPDRYMDKSVATYIKSNITKAAWRDMFGENHPDHKESIMMHIEATETIEGDYCSLSEFIACHPHAHISHIDGKMVDGFCENCDDALFDGEYKSDCEGVKLCQSCYDRLTAQS